MIESVVNIDEIKRLFPDEWVLIGNPEMDKSELNVLSGVPVLHSKDKREVCYSGRSKVSEFQTFTIIYTGVFKNRRVIISMRRLAV